MPQVLRSGAKLPGVIILVRDRASCLFEMKKIQKVKQFKQLYPGGMFYVLGKEENCVQQLFTVDIIKHVSGSVPTALGSYKTQGCEVNRNLGNYTR